MEKVITNREFFLTDKHFQDACRVAEIPETPRQASKFRNKRGLAYEASRRQDFNKRLFAIRTGNP